MKPYNSKSLKNAVATVRNCRKQLAECDSLLNKWALERVMLAKLASENAQFFNPIDVWEAKKLRDSILQNIKQ